MSPNGVAPVATAHDRIALVADEGSLEVWDEDIVSHDPLNFADSRPYRERLAEARGASNLPEAVLTGQVTLDGRPLVVIAGEFRFLGGSIGVATGERVARALERARERRLPVIALPASGGTRMQEGAPALMQMAKLAAAVRRLRDAGLLYVVYLTHPTMGGVLAAWGSLGTVRFAMPGALLGFAGPRVVELITGAPIPRDIQFAEHLRDRGLLDDVVQPAQLRERVARLMSVASFSGRDATVEQLRPAEAAEGGDAAADRAPAVRGDAWASILHARNPKRPAARHVLAAWATDLTILRGDAGGGGDDPACLTALGRVRGVPAVVIAQDRDHTRHGPARMGPAGYRKARRGLALAAELRLPVVTIVDTPGAEMSVAAEEGGLSMEIAQCLADMTAVRSPTLAVLLGEGGSGGALALLAADRVVCAEHATLDVIAPEGASAILYRSTEHAPDLAATQGGASWDLQRFGLIDVVVPEKPSADREPEAFTARLGAAVERELRTLCAEDERTRLNTRQIRYREAGNPT